MELKNIRYLAAEVITACHEINAFQDICLLIIFLAVLFILPGGW